jgi:glycosyltransferase involved in cell wall biosynthesis
MVSRSLKSHTIGGMEYHIDVLTQGLADSGYEVTITTTSHPEGKETETLGKVKIDYLPGMKPGAYSAEWWQNSAEKIRETIDDVDIIHSQSIACYGVLDSLFHSDNKLITTSHGTPITDTISQSRTSGLKTSPIKVGKTLFYFKHHRKLYHSSRKVIAVSEQLAEHIVKWGFASKEDVVTIPNGIDLEKFKAGLSTHEIEEHLNLGDEKILLFVGRVRREKGVDLAIRALPHLTKRLGPVKLIIVGEGDFADKVSPLAKSLGVEDQVLAVGRINEELVPLYYNLADAFLMPSTRWEALPLSLLEAIATGIVVVASDVGGIPSVIEDGHNGILVKKGDLEGLVEGCVRAMSPSSAEIPWNARRTAEERFDARKMVDSVIGLYEETLS